MKIAVCIKQVPTREWQPRLTDDKTLDPRAGRQLRDERARRLCARRGAASQGEARRRSGRLLGRSGPRRAGHSRGAGPRRRSRHSRRGRCLGRPTRSPSPTRWPARCATRRSTWSSPVCSPTTRDTRRPGSCLAERLGMPHATIIMDVRSEAALRVKRELEGGWFQWVAMPLPARADDPERHQPAALRDAEGHHGGEEERDSQGRRRPRRRAAAQRDRCPVRAGESQADAR